MTTRTKMAVAVLITLVANAVAAACGGTKAPQDTGDAAQGTDSSAPDGADVTSPPMDAAPDGTQSSDGDAAPSADGPSIDDSATDEAGDAADAAAELREIQLLCDGIFGAGQRSFQSCCSAADTMTTGYGITFHGLGGGMTHCDVNLMGSLAKGRIAIGASQVNACIAAVQSALLSTPLCWPQTHPNDLVSLPPQLSPSACASAVTGLQQVGAPCFQDYECAAGLTCVGWSTTGDGACQEPPMLGQACGFACPGSATLYFYPFGPHPPCVAGGYCGCTCQAQAPAGASCAEVEQQTGPCQTGLECVDQKCSSGFATAGAPCAQLWDCVDGTSCQPAADGGTGVCTPRAVSGTACDPNVSNCLGSCEPTGDAGDAGSVCVALCGSG